MSNLTGCPYVSPSEASYQSLKAIIVSTERLTGTPFCRCHLRWVSDLQPRLFLIFSEIDDIASFFKGDEMSFFLWNWAILNQHSRRQKQTKPNDCPWLRGYLLHPCFFATLRQPTSDLPISWPIRFHLLFSSCKMIWCNFSTCDN